jgi:pentatricopeptide repeat protein
MSIATIALFLAATHAFSSSTFSVRRPYSLHHDVQTKLHVTLSSAPPLAGHSPSSSSQSNTAKSTSSDHRTQQSQPSPTLSKRQLTDSFNRKIKILSSSSNQYGTKDRRAAEKAERLLREMMQPPHNLPPNPLAYTNAIVAWSRSRDKEAPRRAQALLEEMKVLHHAAATVDKNTTFMQPSKVPYTAVITAWSKSRDRNAGTHALRLLQEMKDVNTRFCSPNAVTYGACISAVSGKKALELLEELKLLYKQGDFSCRPDTIVYSSTIAALAKTQGNYHKAYELLQHMEHESDEFGAKHLTPNAFSYSSAIAACWDRFAPRESLIRALAIVERLLERQTTPNVVVYNSLLDICSQCQSTEAAEKALEIFRSMPCAPDCITYCTVITAFSRSGHARCGRVAVELLEEMTTTSSSGASATTIKPNTFVYGAAIAAQAKCGDAETAQRLFDDMVRNHCLPNTICYNSLISASSPNVTRACQLLRDMYRRYEHEGERFVKPNTVTFNTVLGTMAAAATPTAPMAADPLLDEMKRRTAAGELGVRPDHVTYATLVGIWTDSNLGFEATQRVEALLKEMP